MTTEQGNRPFLSGCGAPHAGGRGSLCPRVPHVVPFPRSTVAPDPSTSQMEGNDDDHRP